MHIQHLLTAITQIIHTHLPELREVSTHAGRFDLKEIKRLATRLPALYQNKFPALDGRPSVHRVQYNDGALMEYDRAFNRLTVQLPGAGTVNLVSPAGVHIEGDVFVKGHRGYY
ncbi:phage baseplate assembly protein V [Zooshikella harenae]|uniref:Phage baseplate assembly protein V n=1 Tax=Zooshikella harenae TaxID=2827238 RepID=A0ABS5ZI31_9GAMM|nr:phage baseplate assembly protein V [Zooshikella harenae]MBU2713734.1 phage baseplate assembly protein V [Zooshikella harenae]